MNRVTLQSTDLLDRHPKADSSIAAGLAVVAWVTDGDGRFRAPQDAWAAYTGQSWRDYQETGWLNAIHPADRELVARRWTSSRTQQTAAHETPARLWHQHDRNWRQVILLATPVKSADGRISEWVGTCLDANYQTLVTDALRRGPDSFTRFLAMLPVAVFACSRNGQLTYFNQLSTELWGVNPQPGDSISIFPTSSPLHDVPAVGEKQSFPRSEPVYPVAHALETGVAVRNERIVIRHRDGKRVDAIVNVTPFFNERNEVTGAIAAFVDLSDQQQAQSPLRMVNQQLDQHLAARTLEAEQRAGELRKLVHEVTDAEQRERRRIASNLHDHLAQVLAAAKMRLAACAHASRSRDLGEIELLLNDAITQTRSLINELNPVMLEDLGLVPAIRWLAEEHRNRHEIDIHVIDGIDDLQLNHSLRILVFHAIRELLSNVVEAGDPREITIRFSHMSRRLVVVVESDCRADTPDSETCEVLVDGSSLSHLCKRIEGLGGSVNVHLERGVNARVTMTLPLEALPAAAEPEAHECQSLSAGQTFIEGARQGISILLVDDHKILRDGLREVLEMGHDMIVIGEASDGIEAVEQAALLKPDVVLMDLSMPRLNGIEATRRIKQQLPDVQVIGLSMHEGADSEKAMRDAGATAFLTKGGQTSDLLEAVRAAVR